MHEDHLAPHAHAATSLADWLIILPFVIVLVVYLLAALRLRSSGGTWHQAKDMGFAAGVVITAWAMSPPMSQIAHGDLRAHMVQHLALGMIAPLGLVLAAPMTLLLRTVPVETGRAIASLLRSQPLHLLSHPLTALTLNIGGMYILYLTPLFSLSMEHPALHLLANVHFLLAGYLFVWSITGPDPAPRRPGFPFRVGVLILSLGLHAFLGKLMYAHVLPSDVPFTEDQIRSAAQLMYYGGDIAEALLAIALFSTWFAQRRNRRLRLSRQNLRSAGSAI